MFVSRKPSHETDAHIFDRLFFYKYYLINNKPTASFNDLHFINSSIFFYHVQQRLNRL